MQIKYVIFDFDGTLSFSNENCWSRIWKAIDQKELDDKYYNMFRNNEIDYREWVYLCFKAFQDNGVDKRFTDEISSRIRLLNNVKEVFEYLKSNDIKIYILSGGIKNLIVHALNDLKDYIEEIDATEFIFNGNDLVDFIDTLFVPENKQEYIRNLIESKNIDPKQILFVGNGKNDETAKLCGVRTLCLNGDDTDYKDKTIWDNYVFTDDLKDILKFVM